MAESDPALYSTQIDREGENSPLTFTLQFTTDTEVTIIECWGTSSIADEDRDIKNGSVLTDLQFEVND